MVPLSGARLALSNEPLYFQDTPWLGGKHDGYPLVPFAEYLRIRDKVSPHSRIRDVAELQCKLTFGLLEAVMEVKIAETELLRVDSSSGKQVLTSENLTTLFQAWRDRIRQCRDRDLEACRKWASRVETTLIQTMTILRTEVSKLRNSTFLLAGLEQEVVADILIQIGSVAEAVGCSNQAFPDLFPKPIGLSFMFILALVSWQNKTGRMFANGWCPFTVRILSESASMLGYARTCKCPDVRLSEGHEKCTTKICMISTRDTSKDAPKHDGGSCNCDNYKPLLEDVVGFLKDWKIPVVHCPPPHDVLSVSDSRHTPFVAISHVWADGLRGTTEKGLPACQIKRLAKMASKILGDPGGAFWVDTLCIPEIDDLRDRAIGLMAQTYKDARAVLVIDSSLREISSSAPREDKLLYVLSTQWMQRLWTFQEAALARRLYFEFSDGKLVHLDELLWKSPGDPLTEQESCNPVLMSLAKEIYRRTGTKVYNRIGFRISDVAFNLRWRTASKESDETLAVSGLLNLDAYKLAATRDSEERMKDFLLRIEKLPTGIIFLSGTKLDKEGFRWAPKSFMRRAVAELSGPYDAICTPTGLEAEYDAIIQDTVVDGEISEWYIRRTHPNSSKECIFRVTVPESRFVSTSYSCNTILFVSNLPPEGLGGTVGAGVLVDPDLVSREASDGGNGGDRILCEFKRPLFLTNITETELSNLEKPLPMVCAKLVRRKVKVV
ncbi:hypothetical protein M758_5G087600 [Ceratodon purpureus]|nr:hypothetical protein M758_5G087600 [Ceratodon purpureus]